MRKFALAAICTFMVVGLALAEEFTLQITKIGDDGTATGTKLAVGKGGKGGKGGFGKGEEVTIKIPSAVQVYKGKFDADSKGFVKEGDDLKLAGLKSALKASENGNVTVGGKGLTSTDVLELSVKDGKPAAKLNGKDIDIADVRVVAKAPLTTRVTTNDDGNVTSVLLTGGGGGFGGGKKKADK